MPLPQIGQYQVQIFVSLTLVLGGVLVALICDYLKGNNELLREENRVLNALGAGGRRRTMAATAPSTLTRQRVIQQPVLQQVAMNQPAAQASPEVAAVAEVAQQPAIPVSAGAPVFAVAMASAPSEPAREVSQNAPTSSARAARRMMRSNGAARRPISADALAVMQRGAAMATAKRPATNIAEDSTFVVAETPLPVGVTKLESDELVRAEVAGASSPAVSGPVVFDNASPENVSTISSGRKRNWSDLLAQRRQKNSPAAVRPSSPSQLGQAVSQSAPQAIDAPVPAGFYDGYVLTRLVQSHKPVSGLVVSIGVSAAQENGEADLVAVRTMIQSWMGSHDFAAASAPDEYLLIFPQERGASAQKRLSEIAQRLWDFQLSARTEASVLFSWGGVEVRGELIEDAIASASERMQERRRGRAARHFDSRSYKMAV